MNRPTAAVVIFFLLMCMKRLLLSLTPLLRYDTHTHTCARAHTYTTAFCWLAQRWLAPTDYQFTLSLVSPWLFPPSFSFFFFLISVSSTLYHLSMRVFVMSIDSNFVLEFIGWVMVIMLVHSICQKWIHVRAWLALRVVHESTTFKGMRESFCRLASQGFSFSS